MNTPTDAPVPPGTPGSLEIDFSDDLQMVLTQAGGRPITIGLGEQGMALLMFKANAAIDRYWAKQATKKHGKN